MKKLFLLLCAAISLASCTTITKTATTADTPAAFYSATVADLEVAKERITYTMTPSADIQRGGLENVKRAAENEALLKNGNADVLVDAEYVISMTNNWIFGKKVNSITVSGRPAKYKNYHSLGDGVWTDPVFRAGYRNNESKGQGKGLFKGLFK